MKVLSILGGRPHLIKAESVHRAFAGSANYSHVTVECWLGSQSDYPRSDYHDFDIPHPEVTIRCGTTALLRKRLLNAVGEIKPELVLLYGDLRTTGVAAEVCRLLKLPFIHIESGYRSGDQDDEEEHIRIDVSHAARGRVAFSEHMRRNLLDENIPKASIIVLGNPALQTLNRRLLKLQHVTTASGKPRGLITFHHDENLDNLNRLHLILQQLDKLAAYYDLHIILYRQTQVCLAAQHLLKPLEKLRRHPSVEIFETLDYGHYVNELLASSFVVTDSSTMQDECTFLNKPCLVFRRATPRAGNLGPNTRLLPALEKTQLVEEVSKVMDTGSDNRPKTELLGTPYGPSFIQFMETVVGDEAKSQSLGFL